jgi:hypothetical protein
MLEDTTSINAFLYFGYVPTPAGAWPRWLDGLTIRQTAGRLESSWIAEGVDLLGRVFRSELGCRPASHVVPLSGGMDSRAILGGLLANLDARRIQAVTFGSPGTWDFEIGRSVAQAAGVCSETMDLTSSEWSWNTSALVQTARTLQQPAWVFDAHVNRQIPERFGTDRVYWSGFMGDPLSGSHQPSHESPGWGQAVECFLHHNRFCHSVDLTPASFDPGSVLPTAPLPGGEGICHDEQLDFAIRQQCLIRHIVLPTGFEYRTPFLNPEWASFLMSLPKPHRQGQHLYKEILKAAYPHLFAMPVKNNFGLPLEASPASQGIRILSVRARGLVRRIAPNLAYSISPGLNYIDFARALRRRQDLQTTVRENLADFKRRGIVCGVDPESLWQRHQRGRHSYADALVLLTSLEILLKARDEGTP